MFAANQIAQRGSAQTFRTYRLGRIIGMVDRWLEVVSERRQLRTLDDRLLLDIAIDRCQAQQEAARPFWDLPRS